MADFLAYATHELSAGGKSDITLSTFRECFGSGCTSADRDNMTDAQARYILKKTVWVKYRGAEIKNQSIADLFLDWCLLDGETAVRRIQRMFGTKNSGMVSSTVIRCLNEEPHDKVFNRLMSARESFIRKDAIVAYREAIIEDKWKKRLKQFTFWS